jgi:hypothetical protein
MATNNQPMYLNHPLHIILSILTGGLWLLVYVPMLIQQGREAKQR